MATRDGGEIKIKISADTSDLDKEAARAASSLAEVGGSAGKAGKGVDKATKKMAKDARRMGELSAGTANTKDEFGELSSSAAALASALDIVDPRLGSAARSIGDLAGSAEGAVKMTQLQGGALTAVLNPAVLAVTATVVAMGAAYVLLSKDIEEANAKIAEQDERMREILPKFHTLKVATMELAVAQGTMKKETMDAILLRKAAIDQWAPMKKAAQEKLALAREQLAVAEEETYAERIALGLASNLLVADLAAQKIHKTIAAERREEAEALVKSLEEEIQEYDRYTGVLIQTKESTAELKEEQKKLNKTTKTGTKATQDWGAALRAAQEAAASLMESLQDEGDAIEQIQKARDAMISAREDAFLDEMEAIDKLGEKVEEKNARFTAAELSMREDLKTIRASFQEEELAAYDEMEQANREHLERIAADNRDADDKEKAAREAMREKQISYASDLSTALVDISSARLDALMAHGDEMTDEQKDRAVAQFRIMQTAAAAEAIVDGWKSAAATMADYGFPAGVPLAALAVAATMASVGAILATPAPSFKTGGIVPGNGETPITAHGGEGVLTANTTRSLGGKGGIDALNNGDITGQLGQIAANTNGLAGQIVGALDSRPVMVQVTLGHEQFDRFIAKDLLRPKSRLKGAIRAGGMSRGLVVF